MKSKSREADPAADKLRAQGQAIRARRRELGLTLSDLGIRCGLSVTFLSFLERGMTTASLGSLVAISSALDVSINYFVAMPASAPACTRQGQRPKFTAGERIYERVTADFSDHAMDGLVIHVPPGHVSEVLASGGEKFIFVLSGSVEVLLDGEEMLLSKGDSLHFQGSRPHQLTNRGKRPVTLLWMGTMKLFNS